MRSRLRTVSMLVGAVAMVAGAAAVGWPPSTASAAPPTPAGAVTRADAALAGHRADAKASSDDVFASWNALTEDDGSADVR